ncbi:hypothetical protein LCGC14_2387140 [marine sediment metagenome]|uniref:Calcineurin-like phosphoesterase domain-containing protein n=1 Tax=marine sediment metagenome TaxID=412755 RepID=A0A0F9BZF5_9ZZZZ
MRIVAFADTHGQHEDVTLPDGDVAVFAGDACRHGSRDDFLDFLDWYEKQSHGLKIMIPGNHDICTEKYPGFALSACRARDIAYLANAGIRPSNVSYYGFPWTPRFGNWAWMKDEGELRADLDTIMWEPDVFISHGPPVGVLDRTTREGEYVGSVSLWNYILDSDISLNIFGHIHEGYGVYRLNDTLFVNCSLMNENYELVNKPVVIELEAPKLRWRIE